MKKFLFSMSLLLSISMSGQVTIGSAEAPTKGALLDLKDGTINLSNASVTASKGLGLPRVKLEASNKLTISTASLPADQERENKAHIGALVYNTKEIVTETEISFCKGLHVWSGEKWKPLKPYPVIEEPTFTEETIKEHKALPAEIATLYPIGPLGYIEDIRGAVGNGEYNRYAYARLYADSIIVSTTKTYTGIRPACTPGAPETWQGEKTRTARFNHGIWMTQNMNTKYFPDNTLINGGIPSATANATTAQFAYPSHEGAMGETGQWNNLQGLVYNFKAVVNKNIDDVNEANTNHEIRQGICPTGWHIPSDQEYTDFEESLSTTASTRGTFIKTATRLAGTPDDPFTLQPLEPNGTSASADMGGFNGLLTGYAMQNAVGGFGGDAYFWTSSSYNISDSWDRYIGSEPTNIIKTRNQRIALYSVRCKKDAE